MAKKDKKQKKGNPNPNAQPGKLSFTDVLERMFEFIKKHKVPVIIGLTVVVGLVVAFIVMSQINNKNREESTKIYDVAMARISSLMNVNDMNERQQVYNQEINNLQGLIQLYPDSTASVRARLFLARSYYEQAYQTGDMKMIDEALKFYSDAYEISKAGFFKAVALLGQAACQEQKNSYPDAFRMYEQIVNEYPKQGFSATALIGMARCKEMQNDVASATEYYAKVKDEFPDSMWASYARGKIYFYRDQMQQAGDTLPLNPLMMSDIPTDDMNQ